MTAESNASRTDRPERPDRRLGTPLVVWLTLVTLANLYAAFRYAETLEFRFEHGPFFDFEGRIHWEYPDVVLLIVSAGACLVTLLGLLLLWLRRLSGLWIVIAAQIVELAALVTYGRFSPLLLIGLASVAVLAWLVLARRQAFHGY